MKQKLIHPDPAHRRYRLAVLGGSGRDVAYQEYATVRELGMAAFRLSIDAAPQGWAAPERAVGALSPNGKPMDLEACIRHGRRIWLARWRARGAHFHRSGPVPGIHRAKGVGIYRTVHTLAARRQACLVLAEEGEVPARAARGMDALPTFWDDQPRHLDRCWKSQRKGRKAWAR